MGKGEASSVTYELRAKCLPENKIPCEIVLSSGQFRYKYIWNWAQMPQALRKYSVSSVTCDNEDNVYALVRSRENPIVVFNKNGEFLRSLGANLQPGQLHGIYVNSDKTMWVCDAERHIARKLSAAGDILITLGTLDVPSDSGYDHTLPFAESYKSVKRVAPPFNRPTKTIQVQTGDVFVSDGYGNAAIHHFSPDFNLLESWGGSGSEPGHFSRPHGLCMDAFGHLWIADRENDRVQVFSSGGEWIGLIDSLLFPAEVWADEHYVYVAEMDGRITIIDSTSIRIAAQLGHSTFPLRGHGIGGNSKGDLFIASLHGEYHVIKLERIQ